MTDWTDAARAELALRLDELRHELSGLEAVDATERERLVRELESRILVGLEREGLVLVTADDVVQVADREGWPFRGDAPPAFPGVRGASTRLPSGRRSRFGAGCLVSVGGVVLPSISLMLAEAWAECAFDPLPTLLHALFIATVPAACLGALGDEDHVRRRRGWLGPLSAFALGTSVFYSLLTLPFVPQCLPLVLLFGFGLLPLSPLVAVAATWAVRSRLRGPDGRAPGGIYGVVAFVLLALYAPVDRRVRQLARDAVGGDAVQAAAAQETLRRPWCPTPRAGRAPHVPTGEPDSVLFGSPGGRIGDVDEARLRWLVFGEPAPDRLLDDPRRFRGAFAVDSDVALEVCDFEGDVDADQALAYGELTLVFRSAASWDAETTTVFELPPGGAVTRASLWNGDVEVPAAFAPVATARAAYEEFVHQARDPILVTAEGERDVRLRCFPVPPRGTMRVRLGVTAPLPPTSADAAVFAPPTIVMSNVASGSAESVVRLRLRGRDAATAELIGPDGRRSADGVLRATRKNAGEPLRIALRRSTPFPAIEEADDLGDRAAVVRQRIVERPAKVRRRVVFAVDGAASLASARDRVAGLVDACGEDREIALVVSDTRGARVAVAPVVATRAARDRTKAELAALPTVGDREDLPLLRRAYEVAAEARSSVVVWCVGIQPFLLYASPALRDEFAGRIEDVAVVVASYAEEPGQGDALADFLGTAPGFVADPRRGDGIAAAAAYLAAHAPGVREFVAERTRVVAAPESRAESGATTIPSARGSDGGSHLARLWARDEIARLVADGAGARLDEALALSLRYGLVSAVAGSVALDSTETMERRGLLPPEPQRTPRVPVSDVPEPETYALLCVAAVAFGIVAWRMRRRARKAFAA